MAASPKSTEAAIDRQLAVWEAVGLLEPLSAICRKHHVLPQQVLSPSRLKTVVAARNACCWHLRELGMSLPEVATLVGFSDHTSVMHAVRQHRKRLEEG